MKHIRIIIALVLLLPVLSACEIVDPLEDVELILDVDDADVDLEDGIDVAVAPDQAAITAKPVQNDLDVTSVEEVREIKLKPEFFAFSPAAGKSGAAAGSGLLRAWVVVGGFPLPAMPIEIELQHGEVVSVSPDAIRFKGESYTIDKGAFAAFLARLADPPSLANWQDATMTEVVSAVNEALGADNFVVYLGIEVVRSDSAHPLSGSLKLRKLTVDARVTKGR